MSENEEKNQVGRPKGTGKEHSERKGRIEFLLQNKIIDHFGRSAMKLEMQRYWIEKYNNEQGN